MVDQFSTEESACVAGHPKQPKRKNNHEICGNSIYVTAWRSLGPVRILQNEK